MSLKNFELIFRNTWFSQEILYTLWDDLTVSDKIEIMVNLKELPKKLSEKAIDDINPIIRMLATDKRYVSTDDEPELDGKLKYDKSLFVKAAIKKCDLFNKIDEFLALTQTERLGIIALSDSIYEESFAKMIIEGLGNNTLSEYEAFQIVTEFVRNKNLTHHLKRKPIDGWDWFTIGEGFKTIWGLTVSTPKIVHIRIAQEYPLYYGSEAYDFLYSSTIPDDILNKMSDEILEILVWRGYKPLLEKTKNDPDRYMEEIRKAANQYLEIKDEHTHLNEITLEDILNELKQFKEDIIERLNSVDEQITELQMKRKGFFR